MPAKPAITPDKAASILEEDLANVLARAKAGKPLTAAQRALVSQAAHPSTAGPGAPVRFARTQAELAKAIGVDRKTVLKWRKVDGNPGSRADGRWDVEAWRAFAESRKGDAAALSQTELKAEQIRLQNEKLAFQLQTLRGEYVPSADVEHWFGMLASRVRGVLLQMPTTLAPHVVGLTVPEAEAMLKDHVGEALRQLHEQPFEPSKG